MNFLIDESDRRMEYVVEILKNMGHEIALFSGKFRTSPPYNLIVSPAKPPVALMAIIDLMPENSLLIGGQNNPDVYDFAQERSIKYVNVTDNEAFAVNNAFATAEGVLMLLLKDTDKVLRGMNVAVIGFGRIGKALAPMLDVLGVRVHVFCTNDAEAALASKYFEHDFKQMQELFPKCDAVINTVPAQVIGHECLEALKKGTTILDLASCPYGFDLQYAVACNLRATLASGLPTKYSPYSAAHYLAEAIIKILNLEERTC